MDRGERRGKKRKDEGGRGKERGRKRKEGRRTIWREE